VRILAVEFVVAGLLGPGLLALTASCAPPPPAAPTPPAPVAAEPAPIPLIAPSPPAPAVVTAQPPAPVVVAAGPAAPAPQTDYMPIPFLWQRMLMQPAPAGRLLLNNFSFETTSIQAVLAAQSVCAIGDGGVVTEFVLPPNGTRILPAPPGWDICWRRRLTPGEVKEIPPDGPWTAWSRAYTGSGRFLDIAVVIPPPFRVTVAAGDGATVAPEPPGVPK
jgi:hypothetical protein